jgi:hypothetical protein
MMQELQGWLTEEEPEMKHLLGDFAMVEQQYEQRSYYDLIDVADKARLLLRACYRVQEAKLDALKQRNEKTMQRWEGYRYFWNSYAYQAFFREFLTVLTAIKATLVEAQASAEKKMHGTLYREIIEKLDQSDLHFEKLQQLTARMTWVATLLDSLKLFGRKLLLTELALIAGGLILLPGLIILLGDPSSGLAGLLRDPWFQKQAIQFITLLVAPILALIQTLWAIMES